MSSPANSEKSPLDAAQKIVTELAGMTADHQSLAIKFAIETLGLKLPTAPTSPAAPPHSPPVVSREGNPDHSTDIRSFTAMKAPKSDRQFTAVVAYFYQFEAKPEARTDTINAEIMKEAARLANWPQVTRWSMTLTNAKNAGYLDAVGSGNFKLSAVGENLVAITLPGSEQAAGGRATKARKPAKKAAKRKTKKR